MADRRSSYIGGSDAATILGLNEYQSLLGLWRRKTGRENSDPENYHMVRGNTIEPIIEDYVIKNLDATCNSRVQFERYSPHLLEAYDDATQPTKTTLWGWFSAWRMGQRKTPAPRIPQIELVHPKYTFIGGHPDGVGKDILWEFKAPAPRSLDRILKEGVSKTWLLQVQHYMWIAGKKIGKIAIWDFNSWSPHIVTVKADPKIQKTLEAEYQKFWECVQMDLEPLYDEPELEEHFDVIDDSALDDRLKEYSESRKEVYRLEDRVKSLKMEILTYADGRKRVTTENHYATIAHVDKGSYSYKRLVVK